MARIRTGRPNGRPSKGPTIPVGGFLIYEEVAVAFLEKARELGLTKTDALTAAMAAFAGLPPRNRQEVIPLAQS